MKVFNVKDYMSLVITPLILVSSGEDEQNRSRDVSNRPKKRFVIRRSIVEAQYFV